MSFLLGFYMSTEKDYNYDLYDLFKKLMLEFRGDDVREISNEASTSAPTRATIK